MPSDKVLTRKEGQFFYITVNRPRKLNTFDDEVYERLANLLQDINADDDIVYTVFSTSAGFFSAGTELSKEKATKEVFGKARTPAYAQLAAALIEHTKVLIALVQGPAIGIAVTILQLFDAVLVSDKATFLTPFTKLGLAAEGASSLTFPLHFGRLTASRLLLFSEPITASEAKDIGFVSHVFKHEEFKQQCDKFIDGLKQLAPGSVLSVKELIVGPQRAALRNAHVNEVNLLHSRTRGDELYEYVAKSFAARGKKAKL